MTIDGDLRELAAGISATNEYFLRLQQQEDVSLRQLSGSLPTVASKLAEIAAQHEAHRRAIKGRFNIFTVLRRFNEETGLHSRYLAHLLNPQEKSWDDRSHHDCGTLFIEHFINILKKYDVHQHNGTPYKITNLDGFDCKRARISREYHIDLSDLSKFDRNGNIDILIECPGWGAIAIENKIWANEQDKQISRYAEYLKRYQDLGLKSILLYLTLHGSQSNTAEDSEYFRISYRDHILVWIEECLRSSYLHVKINIALQQYKSVVSELVGNKPMEIEYMDKIRNLLLANPAIVKYWKEISNGVDALRQEVARSFFTDLEVEIKAYEPNRFIVRQGEGVGGDNGCYVEVIDTKIDMIGNAPFNFEVGRDDSGMYVGASVRDRNLTDREKVQLDLLDKKIRGRNPESSPDSSYDAEGHWPIEGWYLKRIDNDSILSEIVNEDVRREHARIAANFVAQYISLVCTQWAKIAAEENVAGIV